VFPFLQGRAETLIRQGRKSCSLSTAYLPNIGTISGILSQTLDLQNFATACPRVVNLVRQKWTALDWRARPVYRSESLPLSTVRSILLYTLSSAHCQLSSRVCDCTVEHWHRLAAGTLPSPVTPPPPPCRYDISQDPENNGVTPYQSSAHRPEPQILLRIVVSAILIMHEFTMCTLPSGLWPGGVTVSLLVSRFGVASSISGSSACM